MTTASNPAATTTPVDAPSSTARPHLVKKKPPFRRFNVTVGAVEDVTPSLRRVTFIGDELSNWADTGWDQRIKLVFPAIDGGYDHLPQGKNWRQELHALPPERRCPMRSYTTRRVITGTDGNKQVAIDIVLHEPSGPATSWAQTAQVGDPLVLLGPSVDKLNEEPFGIDFIPPAQIGKYLLVGDETAAPAIARILEDLPATAQGIAIIELPVEADRPYVPTHPGFDLRVLCRDGAPRGDLMVEAVSRAAEQLCPDGHPQEIEEIDLDAGKLWEVPRHAKGGAALQSASLYAWLAGEATVVKTLRRILVGERGLDRRTVAFMGYWREGVAKS